MEEQCQIFKNELNRCYNRIPSPIKDHILPRKYSGDDRKLKTMILDINKWIYNSGV
jgi:hypothetical protein